MVADPGSGEIDHDVHPGERGVIQAAGARIPLDVAGGRFGAHQTDDLVAGAGEVARQRRSDQSVGTGDRNADVEEGTAVAASDHAVDRLRRFSGRN